jgi:hypothetical protein
MTLVNCKEINNSDVGYMANPNTIAELIDCGSSGTTVPIGGNGTKTIKNTTLVTGS